MTSHIDAKNASARCLLKWLAEGCKTQKVTDVLKSRVTAIHTKGDESGFSLKLVVNGEYARKILEMKRKLIEDLLKQGYKDQAGLNLTEVFFSTP